LPSAWQSLIVVATGRDIGGTPIISAAACNIRNAQQEHEQRQQYRYRAFFGVFACLGAMLNEIFLLRALSATHLD
jgi:hypothetical protein